MLWDNDDILHILSKNNIWWTTYNNFLYMHQKIDYAKYIILYLYGGIYVDIDAKQLKSFDNLLDKYKNYDLIVSELNINYTLSYLYCQKDKCVNNGIIFSKPNTEIMKLIIDYINENYKCNIMSKLFCILTTTGPIMFSKVIDSYKNKDKIMILKSEYLEPCILDSCNITDNTIIAHHHDGTWYSLITRNIIVIFIDYTYVIISIILLICLLIYIYWIKN